MIEKSKVIDGVYFISIPDVNLYIQCGSPVESVKHLINKGFITKTSKNEVEYETGPNAILLSDVMIQNGDFSNVSEFPVLQMLYKQGLIIPNHPNNTGLKPILIGHENQVTSQMQYIYRGNYGLNSVEEIMACDIDEKLANELYSMKLNFAFGKLHEPTSLLDTCFVDFNKVEIRDGVFIKRLDINIFEISYKSSSITVDLNLSSNQKYISPYTLAQYRIKKEYFSIIQSGQGDGWDTNRPSMNSIVCFQGKYYLVDVVPNINYILDSLSISINEIEGVFLTHCHDDHIAGITTLIRSDKKIKIFGAKIITSSLVKKLSALLGLDELEFQNLLDIRNLEIEQWNNVGDLEIKPILSPHPVETTIYIFRTFFQNKYYSYGHFADIANSQVLKNMVTTNKTKHGISQEFHDKIITNYSQELDLKKIDIGEGMIHGNYKDFIDDKSKKIILAHNDKELTSEQLRIGTSSLFGLQDTLITSKRNYDYKIIGKYLHSNFPALKREKLEAFLNFEIVHFNPKELLYKTHEKIDNLYLIIEGIVEKSSHKYEGSALIEPGAIVGEKPALNKQLVDATFMTKNYVKALKIPVDYFNYFVNKYKLNDKFNKKFNLGLNFLNNKLFNENISYPTVNKLIDNMTIYNFDPNNYHFDSNLVYIVIKGQVNIEVNNSILDTVEKGGYFSGLNSILHVPSTFEYRPNTECILYSIPASLIKEIPIAFWKMLEDYGILQKKLINFSVYDHNNSTFKWNNSYLINIKEMDEQHQEQLQFLDTINQYTEQGKSDEEIYKILDQLFDFSKKHFREEEELMKLHQFDDRDEHKEIHDALLNKISIFKKELQSGTLDKSFIAVVLKEWLLQHMLEEDSKYSRFLNSKEIY